MANILNLITVGQKLIYEVDANPATGGGTVGTVADIALYDNGVGLGAAFLKTGSANTAWDQILTFSAGTSIGQGNLLQVPVYDTSPNGYHLNPTVLQNGQTLGLQFTASPTRSAGIVYNIPNPGDAITSADIVLTEGAQTINGDKTFQGNVVANGNFTVNGTLTYINSTTTNIADKFITLNINGAAASGFGVGFYVEENSAVGGYFATSSDRLGFDLKAPGTGAAGYPAASGVSTIRTAAANQIFQLPNASGTLILQANPTAGVAAQIPFWANATTLTNEVGSGAAAFTWNVTSHFLGIQQATPLTILHVGNNTTSGSVGSGSIILGLLSSSANVGAGALIANGSGGANTASGTDSTTHGASNVASNTAAFAIGTSNTASGTNSFAGGSGSTASGTTSWAFGTTASAAGATSFAIGVKAQTGANAGAAVLTDSQNFITTADGADQMKLRFNNGWKLVKGGGADNSDGPNTSLTQFTVATTNATVTTLATVAIPSNSSVKIEATILGRRTGGTSGAAQDAAVYVRTLRLKNVAGTVTGFNLQSDYTSEDQTTWNGTITVSGTNALVQVTGAANNNVTWYGTVKVEVNS